MIENLTRGNLINNGFDLETIKRLEEPENYSAFSHDGNSKFYACNKEQKIYSGIDALRKDYFRNENQISFPENCYPLMLEYYAISYHEYLKKYAEMKAHNFTDTDEIQAEQNFIENEIKITSDRITELNKTNSGFPNDQFLHRITEMERYLVWLQKKREKLNAEAIKTGTAQYTPDLEKVFSEMENSNNLFCIGMKMKKVIDNFMVLTKQQSKNGAPFLTTEQLISFIQRAFLKDTKQPKQRINLANGEKGFVIKRFYGFFDFAVSQCGELNKKDKYIKLLSDNFDNWDYKTIASFFKPGKTKKCW